VGLNFRIPHTKGMWGKRKNECQGMQSFLHTLILKCQRIRISAVSLIFNLGRYFRPAFISGVTLHAAPGCNCKSSDFFAR